VQQDLRRQAELQQRGYNSSKNCVKADADYSRNRVDKIKEQLEAIEINLENQLFSWGSLKEPFGKLSVWRTRVVVG